MTTCSYHGKPHRATTETALPNPPPHTLGKPENKNLSNQAFILKLYSKERQSLSDENSLWPRCCSIKQQQNVAQYEAFFDELNLFWHFPNKPGSSCPGRNRKNLGDISQSSSNLTVHLIPCCLNSLFSHFKCQLTMC